MNLYGTNLAWEGREVTAEVYAKNGTWIADPFQASDGRFICHSLVFTDTAEPPNTGQWTGTPAGPYDVSWYLHLVGNSADGFPVWAWSTTYGSTECIRPEEWADDILINQSLSEWLSRHTKAQIENLADAKNLVVDMYLTTNRQTPITVHWHNASQHQIDFHLAWFPQGSSLVESIGQYTSFHAIANNENYVLFKENYNAVVNDGGVYHSWGDLDAKTFDTLPWQKQILLNRASLNPTTSADYYHFALLGTYSDANENDEIVTYATERILASIPIKVENAESVKSDIRYFSADGENINFSVSFRVHIDEEIPSDVQDDINITRDIDDDSHDNSDGGKNDTNTTNIQDGTGTDTTGLLTTTYSLTAEQTRILGQKIWDQSYFNVLKIQTNPIENVVSVKAFPFSIAGTSQNIKIGDVDMECTGSKVAKNTKIITVGSVTVPRHFKSFLDYAPFTQIEVFVPYCGIMSLDTSLVMGQTLTFDYIVDLVTGASRCRCKIGSTIIAEWDCTMGVDIPLSSTDRATSDAKHLASIGAGIGFGALGGAVGAISGGLSGVLNGIGDGYHTSRTSGGSPTVSSNDNNSIFLIINRPQPIESAGYNHTYGKMCKLYKTLSSMSGYTEVGEIDLTDIPLTQAESEELKSILKGGFYA